MEKIRTAMYASPHMALLAPLFESIPEQVLVIDTECNMLFANRSFVSAGIDRFGTTFASGKAICNDAKSSVLVDRNIWQRVFRGEEFSMTEQQSSGRKKIFYEISFVPIFSDKKKILAAAAFIRDVSLLRKAEIDLIESRITLQETQNMAGITRFSFGLDDENAEWDGNFENIFGIQPKSEKKSKQSVLLVFPPEDRKRLVEAIVQAEQSDKDKLTIDLSFSHPHLGRRYVHVLGKIDHDSRKFIGVADEVTDIKAVEIALARQNRELENTKKAMLNVLEDSQMLAQKADEKVMQLNAILSSMREALVAVDAKMRIVLINQAAAALFRVAPGDAVGQPVSKICVFYKGDTRIAAKDSPIKKAVEEKTIVSFGISDNIWIKDMSKIMTPVAMSASYLVGDLPVRAIMILRDITKDKEIDTAKNELISLASHQLRTPLSSVNWYSEMLLSGDTGPLTEEQQNYINEIHKGNQRMIDLVNSILNVSRVDLGTITIKSEEVSLKDVAGGALADLAYAVKEKELKVKTEIPAGLNKYNGDKKVLGIIFQNLISNAVKYTPAKGMVKVKVETVAKGDEIGGEKMKTNSIVISVTDTGYGIPEKDKAKIFSKMYRAENVKSMETDGNGLGLYLVKTLVENVGGVVWFNSEEKKGSTFYAALPQKGMNKRGGTTTFA